MPCHRPAVMDLRSPAEEIAFPAVDLGNLHWKSLFRWRIREIPHWKSLFQRGICEIQRWKSLFPYWICELQWRQSLFPHWKREISRRKSLFPDGFVNSVDNHTEPNGTALKKVVFLRPARVSYR